MSQTNPASNEVSLIDYLLARDPRSHPDCHEAAAQIVRLTRELTDTRSAINGLKAIVESKEAEIVRLERDRGVPSETSGEYARGRWEAITEVAAWVDSRVEAEVTHRPDVNIHKRTLANTWGQMQRKLAELLGGEASRKPTADWSPSKTSETSWVAGPPTTAGSHVVHYESGYYAVLTLTPDSMVLRSDRDDNPYGIVRHFKFDSAQKAAEHPGPSIEEAFSRSPRRVETSGKSLADREALEAWATNCSCGCDNCVRLLEYFGLVIPEPEPSEKVSRHEAAGLATGSTEQPAPSASVLKFADQDELARARDTFAKVEIPPAPANESSDG